MALPDKLVIGHFDIPILQIVYDRESEDRGNYDPHRKFISIDSEQCEQMMADTLLHEALHAIWEIYGLPADDEEAIVERLSPLLLALCRFNPGLKNVLFPRSTVEHDS